MPVDVDVLIIGAGLSGVGAASVLKRECPDKTFLVLESRSAIGGTWDLFRYPGIRSDSDMHTLGYSFRPWTQSKSLADGESIREYIAGTVEDEGLASHIRVNHRVISAEWSSSESRWTVTAIRTSSGEYVVTDEPAATVVFTCSFLSVCSGYYRYDEGFSPMIPGAVSFTGALVHPQRWPDDLDYSDKRVVVVGSGATAVTLVPSMARTAAHVTMLQRSPTYIAAIGSRDRFADALRGRVPAMLAYHAVRAKNVGWSMLTYQLARRRPQVMKRILRESAASRLPADFAFDPHLTPNYEPWDQRLCAIPDGDLYDAISRGTAEIITDRISTITPTGIELASGATLEADVIVTATGLNLLYLGGITVSVDGHPIDVSQTRSYKGMMLSGIPNFSMTIGYTNASWTLKADLVARYVTRLLKFMDRHSYRTVTPVTSGAKTGEHLTPLIDLKSGYVLRSVDQLPKQGAKAPWRLHQNYLRDFAMLRAGRLTDAVRFGFAGERTSGAAIARHAHRGRVLLDLPGTATVTVDGLRVRYRRTGEGPPVVLLHGIGQSLEDWTEQHELLASDHTVYSVDLAGFGYSDRVPGAATLDKLTDAFARFLDAVGIATPVPVVGNSLGGAIAMNLAVRHPARVSALILVNSAGFGSDVNIALRGMTIRGLGEALTTPRLSTARTTLRAVFADPSLVTEQRVAHAYRLAQRRAHRRTMLEIVRELGTSRGIRPEWREKLLSALAALDLPMLIIWGDRDQILPFEHLRAAADAFPAARTHIFEKTGHMPQVERPDTFAAVVRSFLSSSASQNAAVKI